LIARRARRETGTGTLRAAYIGTSEQAVQHMIHKRELVVVRKGRRVHLDMAIWIAGSRPIRRDVSKLTRDGE
jgi:hypothetical protein